MIAASELVQLVGREGGYLIGKMVVRVTVCDARVRFGELDVLIRPVSGSGGQWVTVGAVRFDNNNGGK